MQAAEEGRRAEVQSLGLACDAVRLAAEQHQAQEAASEARVAAARSALLHMMRVGMWGGHLAWCACLCALCAPSPALTQALGASVGMG